jgi:hypothetical protein
MDSPPFTSDPDPTCNITMRLSWMPSRSFGACITRIDDNSFNITVAPADQAVLDARAVSDVPANPRVDVALDCFEKDCPDSCQFVADCPQGLTGVLRQDDDVRELKNGSFAFTANETVHVSFALTNFIVGLSLDWLAAPIPPGVTMQTIPIGPDSPTVATSPPLVATFAAPESTASTTSPPSGPPVLPIAIGAAAVFVVLLLFSVGIAVFCKRGGRRGGASSRGDTDTDTKSQIAFVPIAAPATKSGTLTEWEANANGQMAPHLTKLPTPNTLYDAVPTDWERNATVSAPAMTTKYDAVPQIDDD